MHKLRLNSSKPVKIIFTQKSKHPFKHLQPNHTGNEPVKKPRKAKVNKFMENYIAEVRDLFAIDLFRAFLSFFV